MLIAWGLKDFVFDRHFLDEWTRRFPEAEVHRFDGLRPLRPGGRRRTEIIPLVRSFLAAHPVLREVG